MQMITRRGMLGTAAALMTAPLAGMDAARAAAPPSGKQAPGFYRYKVGAFEITVVTDGTNQNPLPDTYVPNTARDVVNAALESNYLEKDKATHSYTPIVVNTGSRLVVMDTGLGPAIYQQSKGAVGQFQTNLAAAGIDRNAVDSVVISHFHGDHINGLLTADNTAAYPNAEILVPAVEWTFWMDDANMGKAAGSPLEGNFKNVRRVFGALGKKVTPYEAGKEVAPGITSIATPGHTPGHTSYVVASGSSKVLVQADVTAGMALLFVRNPGWQFGFDMDKPQAEATRRKLYDMAIAEKMPVQGFHFPFPALGHVEKDGNGYRLVPSHWNPTL